MNDFIFLNPDDFKRWIKKQPDFDPKIEQKNLIGLSVETKFGSKRISKHMIIESGSPSKVLKEFINKGGVIKEVDEDDLIIEVSSGTFQINKKFVIV